jgi:hypothetical protein
MARTTRIGPVGLGGLVLIAALGAALLLGDPVAFRPLVERSAGLAGQLADEARSRLLPPASPGSIEPITPATAAADPVPAATATPRGGAFRSEGLGATRAEWERAHGPPSGQVDGLVAYERGVFRIGFREERVARLERAWGDQAPVLLDGARIESRTLLPRDARFVRTRVPVSAPGQPIVDVYRSESLIAPFPSAPWRRGTWTGGEPGNLIARYRVTPDLRVTAALIGLGDE